MPRVAFPPIAARGTGLPAVLRGGRCLGLRSSSETSPVKRLLPVTVAAVLLLSGCASPAPPAVSASSATVAPSPEPSPSPTALAPSAVDVPRAAATLAPAPVTDPPAEVAIDALGVNVPIVPVGVDDTGFMEIPEDPAVGGWYRFGPQPDTGAGNTVIAAHIDSPDYPIGPFASLRDAPAGAEVRVRSSAGVESRWAVQTVTYYAKTDLDTDALFARTGPATLVLVTCGGEFDSSTGHYRDNVVLVATPMP